MKWEKRRFNQLLLRFRKDQSKLRRLESSGRNLHRQHLLRKRVRRLFSQLRSLFYSIRKATAVGAVATISLAASHFGFSQQTPFTTPEINPFGLTDVGTYNVPALADIDNDGDLDLFSGATSGDFFFFENEGTNFDPDFGDVQANPFGIAALAAHSAPALADLDNDGDLDLMSGSEDGNFEFFQNDGNSTSPVFGSKVSNPFGLVAIGIDAYSTISFADIDDDGDLDLLSNDYDYNLIFFENIGTASSPSFGSAQINPFNLADVSSQGLNMVPVFIDLDVDGDFDILTGNSSYGIMFFFKNIGTKTAPDFADPVSNPFSLEYIDGEILSPSFGDIDGDGDQDLIVGADTGIFYFFDNGVHFLDPIINSFGLTNVGDLSAPYFVDLDNDGDMDIMSGEDYGDFFFFENEGTSTSPSFGSVQTNPFGLVGISGTSGPAFVDIDNDLDLDMFSSTDTGAFNFFENIGTVTNPSFGGYQNNPFGLTTVPDAYNYLSFADIDDDGDFDLIAADYNNIAFFENEGTASVPSFGSMQTNPFGLTSVNYQSAPFFVDLDNDGDFDIVVGDGDDGAIWYFKNNGTASNPSFLPGRRNPFNWDPGAFYVRPTFADIDGDGDVDLLAGGEDGDFRFLENIRDGSKIPFFNPRQYAFGIDSDGYIDGLSAPAFVDIDNDGDLDLFSGEMGEYGDNGSFIFFQNTGTAELPAFEDTPMENPFSLTAIGGYSAPTFADIDNDGDYDMFSGDEIGDLRFFSNNGTANLAQFGSQQYNPFGLTTIGYNNSKPVLVDLNNDGDMDLFVGSRNGDFVYFENTGSVSAPAFGTRQVNPFSLNPLNDYSYASPTFADFDDDGDLDLLVGADTVFHFFENVGTAGNAVFGADQVNPLSLQKVGDGYMAPTFADMDGDGHLELISGEDDGDFYYLGPQLSGADFEEPVLNDATDFVSFSVPDQTATPIINAVNHTIEGEVAFGTDLTVLKPTFTLSDGASTKVGSTTQVSGATANDFSSPVTYTVTAEDGETVQDWTATVTAEAGSDATDFLTFSLSDQVGDATIDSESHTISILLKEGTNPVSLVATFTLSEGATALIGTTEQESGVTLNNFSSPVVYTINAQDQTTNQDWTVIVVVQEVLSTETDIVSFSFTEQTDPATIDAVDHSVNIEIQSGTVITNLVATFSLSEGASAKVGTNDQVSGVTSNDFSSPLLYTITAEDQSTSQDWTVTVTREIILNDETDFLSYSLQDQAEDAIIDKENHMIDVVLNRGAQLSSQIAIFEISPGANVLVSNMEQLSGVTSNDFTIPVEYEITAEDGLTKQGWIVNASLAPLGLMEELDISTYPNPVQNLLNIQLDEKASEVHAQVFAISGVMLLNTPLKKRNNELDVSKLPKGVYLLRLNQKGKLVKILRFVKM